MHVTKFIEETNPLISRSVVSQNINFSVARPICGTFLRCARMTPYICLTLFVPPLDKCIIHYIGKVAPHLLEKGLLRMLDRARGRHEITCVVAVALSAPGGRELPVAGLKVLTHLSGASPQGRPSRPVGLGPPRRASSRSRTPVSGRSVSLLTQPTTYQTLFGAGRASAEKRAKGSIKITTFG